MRRYGTKLTVKSPLRWYRLWLLKRRLIERSQQHRLGYAWAISELQRGRDPEPRLFYHTSYNADWSFDIGAADAIFDWGRRELA